jgi:hypothetical protein
MAIRKITAKRNKKPPSQRERDEFWARLDEIGRSVPDEEWARLPKDLARNFDRYLEGPRPRRAK